MANTNEGALVVNDNLLAGNTAGGLAQTGVPPLNTLRLASNVADGETVTIAADVYEFDNNNTITAGRIQVNVSAGLTPAIAGPALAAAINANPASRVFAVSIAAGARILIYPRRSADYTLTGFIVAETLAGASNAWDSSTVLAGGKTAVPKFVAVAERVPIAAEVTAGVMDFLFPFAPVTVMVDIVVTATNIRLAWDGGWTIDATTKRVTLDNAGAVDWAATHTVRVTAWS